MSEDRQNISSGSKWEPLVGYSRAVRVGSYIHVSGTTATDTSGEIVGPDDPAAQMRQCLENISRALAEAGSNLTDVVRTRIFITNISAWKSIGAVHAEYFGAVRPATSMVEVSALIDPKMIVEVEADAYIDSD